MKDSDMARLLVEHNERLDRIEKVVFGEAPDAALPMPEPAPPQKKKRKRKKAKGPELDLSKLDDMSISELVQVCRTLGHAHASRQLLREDLIALILGDNITVVDPIGEVRERLYKFVKENPVMVSTLPCDRECLVCPHNQVVHCHLTNHDLVD